MMVDLQNLKNAISTGQFSEEAKALMLPIIDAAIARGSMTAGEKKKLQDIMDVEIDGNALEQSAHEEAAEIIEGFLAENDAAIDTAGDNIDSLEKEAEDESRKIQEDLKNSAQISAQPQGSQPEPVPPVEPPVQPPAQ